MHPIGLFEVGSIGFICIPMSMHRIEGGLFEGLFPLNRWPQSRKAKVLAALTCFHLDLYLPATSCQISPFHQTTICYKPQLSSQFYLPTHLHRRAPNIPKHFLLENLLQRRGRNKKLCLLLPKNQWLFENLANYKQPLPHF